MMRLPPATHPIFGGRARYVYTPQRRGEEKSQNKLALCVEVVDNPPTLRAGGFHSR